MPVVSVKRLCLLALAVAIVGLIATMAHGGLLLALLPALVLLALLAAGVFPGEDAIGRLAARGRPRRRRALRRPSPGPLRRAWRPSRLLLASSLASRPPPAGA